MANVTFYPGPSRVYSNVPEYIYEAHKDGIMTINHRSDAFMELAKQTKSVLHEKLGIPQDYRILFLSSATESWEVTAQSLTKNCSQHFYNGAFGKKWHQYADSILDHTLGTTFGLNSALPIQELSPEADCICLTHCETSNGTFISSVLLEELDKQRNPDQLVTIDATSSMGGLHLPWEKGDYWYASVQKCFGLPAGLGIAVVSPKAVKRAEEIGEKGHYNSLLRMLENEAKHQTHLTPNVLGIYLLYRTQEYSKTIDLVEEKLRKRFAYWIEFLEEFKEFTFLAENPLVRSPTVVAISSDHAQEVKKLSQEAGITLGNGYGDWKASSFRIANFPAIKRKEIELLSKFLRKQYSTSR
ncbi:MAG: aminotransferase class V-fold PLP-dependent enzyme [Cytophagales bacterium]|nr:aminotransferase class V-fold PLP-dependent enzyme [Cytophagales bacterium]